MARPDPALLDPARYPFRGSIETRFADLDLNQHINNVAMTGMLEEGRVRFHRETSRGRPELRVAPMVASLSVEFLGQSYFPDPLDVHVAFGSLGRTSYTLCQLVTQQDRIVAFARSVLVNMNDDGPAALSPAFHASAQAWTLKA